MITKVDWYSFTFPCYVSDNMNRREVFKAVNQFANHQFGMEVWNEAEDDEWKLGGGRAPFAMSFYSEKRATTVFVGSGAKVALIEITGKGCARLEETGDLRDLLKVTQERATRIDLACDILTDLTPLNFTLAGYSGRFKSHSEFTSESGSTVYIGSRTSDRYCRVYRYNEPHERAHLLRIEYVFKAEEAKQVAGSVVVDSVEACAAAAGNSYAWKHPAWKIDAPTEAEIKAYRPERHEGKTLFWLNDTIAPLLVRLHRAGVLDVRQWFDENIDNLLYNDVTD